MTSYQLYLSVEDQPLIMEFKKIARREGRPTSSLIKELMRNYVKDHREGNPNFPIEKWQSDPSFTALPTLGETNRRIRIMGYDLSTVKEIRGAAEAWAYVAERELMRRGESS